MMEVVEACDRAARKVMVRRERILVVLVVLCFGRG